MTLVVDASVAVKWLVSEPNDDLALAPYGRASGRMHAPDLLLVEVAGAVVRRANERLIDLGTAHELLDEWLIVSAAPAITIHAVSQGLVHASARLAIELGHPVKDCVYLALAIELGCPLVTADAKFRDRAVARHPEVRLLAELV